jgi:hypothetical protein
MPKSKERDELCGKYVPMLRRKIQLAGSMLVNYNPLSESLPNFPFVPNHWRIVWAYVHPPPPLFPYSPSFVLLTFVFVLFLQSFSNPEQTFEDALFVLDEMDRLGEDMTLGETAQA